ncbi:MAG: hypothetical protein CSA07_01205 [Bacteroidia bacterium]|nr:MAG: hypothetical protein CSA07_01205 [Bacteroidia bacterium]
MGNSLGPVALVGAGGVASALGEAFAQAGIGIASVYSRTREHAELLAGRFGAEAFWGNGFGVNQPAALTVVASTDTAIVDLLGRVAEGGIVVHTSGSTSLPTLPAVPTGVFYPLQTFTLGRRISLEGVPIFIEGSTRKVEQILSDYARAIGARPIPASSSKRRHLHLMGVVGCNFVNALLGACEQIAQCGELDPHVITPLLHETIQKWLDIGAHAAQTGPAKRRDEFTLMRHRVLLSEELPDLIPLYETLSELIVRAHAEARDEA